MTQYHDKPYLALVEDVLKNGRVKQNRTGDPARAVFARQMRFDLSDGTIPMLTSKKMFTRGTIVELLDLFIAGTSNIKNIQDQKVTIWDEWASPEGHLNKVYRSQWRKWENPNWMTQVTEVAIRPDGINADYEHANADHILYCETDRTDELVGQTLTNNKGDAFRVIKKRPGVKNSVYTIQFDGTNSIVDVLRPNLKRGQVSDPYKRTVFGVGCIGQYEETHPYRKDAYTLWYNMMRRCYDASIPEYQLYGGRGVFVDQSWRCFANFLRDIHDLVGFSSWKQNQRGYDLDKDYWGANSYGPSTCIFLPGHYNRVLPKLDGCKYIATNKETGKRHEFTVQRWFANQQGIRHSQVISTALTTSPTSSTKQWTFERIEPKPGYLFRQNMAVDQLQVLIDKLKANPLDRRLIVTAWNVADLAEMALPPCHYLFQCYTEELTEAERSALGDINDPATPKHRLSMMLNQRSADVGLGVPFNIVQYSMLLHMIAHVTGLAVGEFIWSGGDIHIYENHVEKLTGQLNNPIHPSPTLRFARKIDNIDDFKLEDFIIEGYIPGPKIDMPVAV